MGRISKKIKKPTLRTQLKNWSKAVRARDGNKCFLCGSTERLNAHHILPKKMWSKEKLDPRVGITLCCKCHSFGKFSVHRGAGDVLLMDKLQKEHPEQWSYILTLVKADKFLDEYNREHDEEPIDELDWPENQIDDDGSDDWCKNGW